MDALPKIKISKHTYYSTVDLLKTIGSAFKGCYNGRLIITKYNVPTRHYVYAAFKDNQWVKTDGKSRKCDKVFLTARWVEKNVSFDDLAEDNIEMAPDLIELEDSEKFQDHKGNVVEIEVRGIRESDKCYFRVSDIMEGFGIERLHSTVTNKTSGYVEGEQYKYFYLESSRENVPAKTKRLYLTYDGLMHALYGSHKKTTSKFLNWASNTLFKAHLGTSTQKKALVSELLGVTPEVVTAVFNKSATDIPCIYLFKLGKVGTLRKSLKIGKEHSDNDVVYKYGMTDSIKRRTKEHKKAFEKIDGCCVELEHFAQIDPQFISKAETKIKHYFSDINAILSHEKFREVVIIPKKMLSSVYEQYGTLAEAYKGHLSGIISQLKEKDHQIELLQKQNELTKKDSEIELLKRDAELLRKDLEIQKLKRKKRDQ